MGHARSERVVQGLSQSVRGLHEKEGMNGNSLVCGVCVRMGTRVTGGGSACVARTDRRAHGVKTADGNVVGLGPSDALLQVHVLHAWGCEKRKGQARTLV
jgi:hypothetical protein